MEVALFGAGFAGQRYLKALNYFHQCNKQEMIVYLYDTRQDALDNVSNTYGVDIFSEMVF